MLRGCRNVFPFHPAQLLHLPPERGDTDLQFLVRVGKAVENTDTPNTLRLRACGWRTDGHRAAESGDEVPTPHAALKAKVRSAYRVRLIS